MYCDGASNTSILVCWSIRWTTDGFDLLSITLSPRDNVKKLKVTDDMQVTPPEHKKAKKIQYNMQPTSKQCHSPMSENTSAGEDP